MENEEETKFDLVVTTTDAVWRQIMAKDKSAAIAVLKKELEVHPSAMKLQSFMSYFDTMWLRYVLSIWGKIIFP